MSRNPVFRSKKRVLVLLAGGVLMPSTPSWSQQGAAAVEADGAPSTGDEVVVSGTRQAYLGDVPRRDVPQSIRSVQPETLRELGVTRLGEALDLVSGVAELNDFGGLWESYSVRGFAGDANNVPTGFLVNGFNGGRGFSGPRDTASVARIDVLKGPTSALFGRGEPGGTVNIVTKKPEFRRSGHVQLQTGSFERRRLEADFTTPLSGAFAVRVNGAYDAAGSFRETVESARIFLTPSMLWRPSAGATVSYELEFGSQDIDFDRGVPIIDGVHDRLPRSRFLGEPGDGPFRIDVLGHQFEVQHDLGGRWSLLLGAAHRTTHIRGSGQYPELVASRQPLFVDGRTLSRQRRYTDHRSENLIGRAELSGRFDLAGMGNAVAIGADYDYFELDQLTSRSRPPILSPGLTLERMNAIDVFDPVYGAYPLPGARPGQAGASIVFSRLEQDHSWGTYIHDQVDLAPWLKVRIGGRYDEFRQRLLNRAATNPGIPNPARQTVARFSPQWASYFSRAGRYPSTAATAAASGQTTARTHGGRPSIRRRRSPSRSVSSTFRPTAASRPPWPHTRRTRTTSLRPTQIPPTPGWSSRSVRPAAAASSSMRTPSCRTGSRSSPPTPSPTRYGPTSSGIRTSRCRSCRAIR